MRTILLVDMNSFFASIEQQCNMSLRGKPVLVGGSSSKRSVVAAASYEARFYGIHSGMPLMEAWRLCPNAVLVEGNIRKYTDAAHRVFQICQDYTDRMEIYSIDECFLDVTDMADAWEVARNIKRRIREDLGLTCSIGIAPNKMLAKLASGMQKPDGLTEIKREEIKNLLENLPVERLHGIGEQTRIKLARMGITKAGALGRVPRDRLKRAFGILGDILHEMGSGIDCSPVVPYHSEPDIKSVGHSYTLSRNTRDPDVINRQLLRLSEMVGRRLREQNYAGRTVTLTLRYGDMHTFSRQKSFPEYFDDGFDIYQAALSILHKQEDDGRAIRLLGICVSSLVRGIYQLDMFAGPRRKDLQKIMDAINDKYGEFTIKRASLVDVDSKPKTHGFEHKELSYRAIEAWH